ncbi:MAG: hypothetical protein ACTHW7_12430 [Actinomycetaceae bacterium]
MHIASYPTDLSAPGAIEQLLAAHRRTFGDLRMELTDGEQVVDDGSGQPPAENATRDGSQEAENGNGDPAASLEDVMADIGVTPDQLKARLEASKKWEQRAKANVPHEDHEKVKAELTALRQASESDVEKQVREAREQATSEARAQIGAETVQAMARMALRSRGVKDEEITSFVTETNLSAFVSDDGQVDDERLLARVDRYAGTAGGQRWPGTGQDRRGSARRESGSDLYDRMHGSKK